MYKRQGWYGDSGWQDYGWVGYGGSAHVSASVWYLGWSNTHYNSSVDAWYSPDVPTWKPNNVMSQVAVLRSNGTAVSYTHLDVYKRQALRCSCK